MIERSSEKTIEAPAFVCEDCGFANVVLTDSGAECTSCGVQYRPKDYE